MKIRSQPSTLSSGKKAFTLIELLVVIAIIAILAAILFPVFARARENARRSSCTSNLKQIALAIKQYQQDFDEKFPLAVTEYGPNFSTPDPLTNTVGWGDAVQPYLKSAQIFQCPSEPSGPAPRPFQNGYADYFYNAALAWNGSTGSATRFNDGINEAKLEFSSLTILVGDYSGGANARTRGTGRASISNNSVGAPGTLALTPFTASNVGNAGLRHLEGMNFAFTDGHAKWYKCSSDNECGTVYQMRAPFSESKQNPTFHTNDE